MIFYPELNKLGYTGASCPSGQGVIMALLRKEFTRAQHRSHTRCVREFQLFSSLVRCDRINCLIRDRFLHFLSRQVKFDSQFSRNRHEAPFPTQWTVILSWRVSFYRIRGLVNNINMLNMAVVSLLQVKNDAGACYPKFHGARCHSKNRPKKNISISNTFLLYTTKMYCESSDDDYEYLYVVFHC